jgi:Cas6b C-terminal domain/Cas6b N-terminal domain
MTIPQTIINFPEISLLTRDAHKLRGFFGNIFKEHSILLHNHFQEDDSFRQGYSLVQYKVLHNTPTLVGLGEGADLLVELFLKMKHIEIDGQRIDVFSKNINHATIKIGVCDDLHHYKFENLWMPLNQDNHKIYVSATEDEKKAMLNRILRNNILAFLKGMDATPPREQTLLTKFTLKKEKESNFKNQKMITFLGDFITNVELPTGIGLGKSVARGFGSICRV